ncbi:hypothetical protein H0W91_02140 [Patescibacteria group bacterium]|nr:hypothetical protein [Patescibacteria group bacterium]
MKKRFLILLLILVIVVEGVLLIKPTGFIKSIFEMKPKLISQNVGPEYLSDHEMINEKNRWSKIMDEIGPEKAYAKFKDEYSTKNFGTQHVAAHIIGALLYQKAGLNGQAICDSTFSFGCYHSFFSQALTDKGPSIISSLNQVCLDKFGPLGSGCQHGIGHGVMDYFGQKHLLDALKACKPTTSFSAISGCTSGVFMEYNVPIIVTETDANAISRPLDTKNPYAPCPALPKSFQESCYYSIGQWWDQTRVYKGDWKSQGLLCKNIPDVAFMETCYLGIGNVTAPDNNYDPKKTIESCQKMPNQKAIVTCQAGASWSFAANPDFKPLAIKICDELNDKDKNECLRIGNLLNPNNNR